MLFALLLLNLVDRSLSQLIAVSLLILLGGPGLLELYLSLSTFSNVFVPEMIYLENIQP